MLARKIQWNLRVEPVPEPSDQITSLRSKLERICLIERFSPSSRCQFRPPLLCHPLPHLLLDPPIRSRQALFERDRWLPFQHAPQKRVIGIPAAHAHWPGHMFLRDLHARNRRHHVRQLVDGHHAVLAQVEWLAKIRPDRKSTRLNSSHITISYAVFCLKKKNTVT